jgi:RHS repeat-associated protein
VEIPGTSYNYDNNGSLTSKSDGTAYTWDFENRLTQVTLPGSGGTVTFKYDPFGRRIQKAFIQGTTTTTTNYVYDGANAVEEVDANAVVLARYTQGMGIDEPLAELRSSTTSYYEADGLDSITSLSNTAGALANTYTYDSFGKLTASTGTIVNPFQYTARDSDSETGLRYYRARYYDQNVGRFISEDPIAFGAGTNLYAYVGNSPTDLVDPFGLKGQHKPGPLPPPVRNPLPNAIQRDFEAYEECVDHNPWKECEFEHRKAEPPPNMDGETPGPGDFGVTPDEGTLNGPNYDEGLHLACDCLRQHPMAALDRRFNDVDWVLCAHF